MLIQIDIPKELNKSLRIFIIGNEFKNKQEALIYILENFFKELDKK